MATYDVILIRVFVAGGALMVVAFVAGFFVLRARRRMLEKARADGPGFVVEELEAMRRSGQISAEEFRALRRKALGLAPESDKDNARPAPTPQSLAAAMDDKMDRPDQAIEVLDELAEPGPGPEDQAGRQDDVSPEGQKRDNASSSPPERDDENDIPARD
jgi:hypothetical protein